MADEIKTLKVGVAQSDITPPIGTCLAGYFNKRVSTGIIHPLRAKAIVAGSGDERVALITCDLITMTAEVCQRVRKIVHDATGILESHVMICSTHTHTGPDLRPSNANCPRNEEYYEGVPARIAQAAIDAANSQKDAVMCIGTEQEEAAVNEAFGAMQSISIDYGVMEKAENVYVLPSSFGWDDVGSWLAVGRINPGNEAGNVIRGDVVTISSTRCIVEGGEKLIAMVGLEDTIIVDTKDALLVCAKDHAAEIRKVLETLKAVNRTELL